MIPIIVNHIDQALDRLITQYKDRDGIRALVSAFCAPIQTLEDAIIDMNISRTIDGSVGVQLDGLGAIVGIERLGLEDFDYRIRIKAKVLINISEGEPEIIIAAFNLLTESTVTILQEYYPGGVGLSSDGVIPLNQIDIVAELIEKALSAGVRLDSMAYFDPVNPFSFDGTLNPAGGGFGSLYDAGVGGKFAGLYSFGKLFGFSGSDMTLGGFGSIYDPNLGGMIAS